MIAVMPLSDVGPQSCLCGGGDGKEDLPLGIGAVGLAVLLEERRRRSKKS